MYVDNNLPFLLEQSGKKGMKWGVRKARPSAKQRAKKYGDKTIKNAVAGGVSGAALVVGQGLKDNAGVIRRKATVAAMKGYIKANGGVQNMTLQQYKDSAALSFNVYRKSKQLSETVGSALTTGGTIGLASSGAAFLYNAYRYNMARNQLRYGHNK